MRGGRGIESEQTVTVSNATLSLLRAAVWSGVIPQAREVNQFKVFDSY